MTTTAESPGIPDHKKVLNGLPKILNFVESSGNSLKPENEQTPSMVNYVNFQPSKHKSVSQYVNNSLALGPSNGIRSNERHASTNKGEKNSNNRLRNVQNNSVKQTSS